MSNNTPDYNDNLYFDCTLGDNDLTKQWRKGELPEGWYWVKKKTCEEYIDKVYFWYDTFIDGDVPLDNDKVIEVLAHVPSYEKWKAKLEENAQLKEKIERLKKQLNIAIGVLSQYAEASTRNLARCALDRIVEIGGDYSHYWEQQIKELNK